MSSIDTRISESACSYYPLGTLILSTIIHVPRNAAVSTVRGDPGDKGRALRVEKLQEKYIDGEKSDLFAYSYNTLTKCSSSRLLELVKKMEQYTSTSSGEQIVVQAANGQIQQQVSKRGGWGPTFGPHVTIE